MNNEEFCHALCVLRGVKHDVIHFLVVRHIVTLLN